MIPSTPVRPLLLLLLLICVAVGVHSEEELGAREQDLQAVELELRRLEQDLQGRQSERSELLAELERTERYIGDLARAGRQLDGMISVQQRISEGLDGQVAAETVALQAQQQILGQLFRSAYAMGRGEVFRLVMSQNEVRHFGRLAAYYSYFGKERARRIAEIDERRASLQALAEQARQEAQRLTVLARQQEKTRLRLVTTREERNDVLARLEGTILSGKDRIAALEEGAGALRAVIEQLRRSAEILGESEVQQGSIAEQRQRLRWPTMPARLLAQFGDREAGNELHSDGVLLASDPGAAVRAVYHGRIVFADWLRGFGLLIIVDHGDGYMSLYGHNQALLKEAGEWVRGGDQLALSGASGGLRQPGVYFALRLNGEPLDPAKWCGSDES